MSTFLRSFLMVSLVFTGSLIFLQAQNKISTPEEFFGFVPGTNRELFSYEELIDYLNILDQNSNRVKMIETGKSPMGKPIYICFISSPENIADLENLKAINKRLALDPEIREEDRKELIDRGKVFVLATLSMHSPEVGPTQAAPLIIYDLITTEEPEKIEWLENVVYMMVPCHNPDGMNMIVENYIKNIGTKYEGSAMPSVYHKYIGHDNNRDFVTLSQADTKVIASIYNLDWFPQVMVEKHQMGSTGVRYFVPPPHDPIAENVDAGIWNWIGLFGSNMIKDMTKDSLAGIAQHYLYDDFWPGSTNTSVWKNVIGILTEAASAKVATPIFIESNELTVVGKGLSEYKKSVNMPLPWNGGWWGLSDIVRYEISSMLSILKTASANREDILKFRNDLCRIEVNKGKSEAPYYYIMPMKQNDQGELAGIINLLREHGVNLFELKNDVNLDNVTYRKGDIVIPLAQPYRPFIKEVMEVQEYPLRHYTLNGEIIRPYDVTSWSLPLHRGVQSIEINVTSELLEQSILPIDKEFKISFNPPEEQSVFIFSSNNNESYKAAFMALGLGMQVQRLTHEVIIGDNRFSAGSFVIRTNSKKKELLDKLNIPATPLLQDLTEQPEEIKMPRIALVESWFQDLDAGWTRFLFDDYGIPFFVLRPQDFEKTELKDKFDILVFPSEDSEVLKEGKFKKGENYYISNYPPEFTKGIGVEGMIRLMDFLDNGGIIISWGESVGIFDAILEIKHGKDEENKEEFRLPFRNVAEDLKKEGLYCPGSLLRVNLVKDHPLTWGMQEEAGILFLCDQVFTTSIPNFDMDRRVIASFPEKDLLMSGYIEKGELLANKSAMIWLKKGMGQLVVMAFNPQFRASTQGTYKLLFNSLLLKK
jgi:hypothetical protein